MNLNPPFSAIPIPVQAGGGMTQPYLPIPPKEVTPFNLFPPAPPEQLADTTGNNAFFNNLNIRGSIVGGTPGLPFVGEPFIIQKTLRFNNTGDPTAFTTDIIAEDFNTIAIRGPEPADVNRIRVYGYYNSSNGQYERTSYQQNASTSHITTESNDGTGVELIIATLEGFPGDTDCPITIAPGKSTLGWVFRANTGHFGPQNAGVQDILGIRNVNALNYISTTGGFQFNPTTVSPANTLRGGVGAPATGLGAIGDMYFRADTPGTANQRIYIKTAAAVWTALVV